MRKSAWSGAVVGFLLGLLVGAVAVKAVYDIPYAMAGDYWRWKDRMWLWKEGWKEWRGERE